VTTITPTTTVTTITPTTTVTTVTPTTATSAPTTTPTTTTPVPTSPTTTSTITPTVTPTGVPDFTLTFERGWNHVSIPRALRTGADTGAIFSTVPTDGHSIWRYNTTLQLFERIYPITALHPTDSVWVYSSGHTTIPLYFSLEQGFVERDLFRGWNGFGITTHQGTPARDTLSPVDNYWDYLYGFDPLNQTYEISIVKNGAGSHSDTRLMYPGNGYWLHMNKNSTFEAIITGV